jgi:hypothetical protein
LSERSGSQGRNTLVDACGPSQTRIVNHDRHVVGSKSDVELDAISAIAD